MSDHYLMSLADPVQFPTGSTYICVYTAEQPEGSMKAIEDRALPGDRRIEVEWRGRCERAAYLPRTVLVFWDACQ